MKRNVLTRFACAAAVALLGVVLSTAAMAAPVTGVCKQCDAAGLECTGLHATATYKKISETQHAQYYECNNGHKQLRYNENGSFRDVAAHVANKNATCTEAAVCGDCGASFGAPLDHDVVIDPAVPATCTKTGLTEGKHCARPGCGLVLVAQEVTPMVDHVWDAGKVTKPTCSHEGYTTYTCKVCNTKIQTDKTARLSHWYDVWTPTTSGMHSAPCKREGCTYVKETNCVEWNFKLTVGDETEDYTVCPVCGALSDGGHLELVDTATPKPITGWTPKGDMVLRFGDLENGERIISLGFEFDAKLTQCTGKTRFNVPAEMLDGYKLMLVAADGTETELEVETNGQTASFVLDWNAATQKLRIPVRIMHLVPVTTEAVA